MLAGSPGSKIKFAPFRAFAFIGMTIETKSQLSVNAAKTAIFNILDPRRREFILYFISATFLLLCTDNNLEIKIWPKDALTITNNCIMVGLLGHTSVAV